MSQIEQDQFMALPIEARRDLIREEVAAGIKKEGIGYINTFSDNLPGGHFRRVSIRGGLMDVLYKNLEPDLRWTQDRVQASDIKWNQTPRQFFETIDRTIQELGISTDHIQTMQNKLNMLRTLPSSLRRKDLKDQNAILEQMYTLTVPVYIELRAMGYTRQDLAG